MKRKRIVTLLIVLSLLFSLTSCKTQTPAQNAQAQAPSQVAEEQGGELFTRGTMMSLADDDTLEITRSFGGLSPKPGPQDGIWTVFVYMCGADLESGSNGTAGGAASNDLEEMRAATAETANLRFVVLAGGASRWNNDSCADGENTWLVIENGALAHTQGNSGSMGDANTLYTFLTEVLQSYDSQYTVLNFWDHGGGSLSGVCFDECYGGDSLNLVEIDRALSATYQATQRRFDVIGFDACLMATVETANLLVPYGDYMLASQENEPGTGWNYRALGQSVAGGATDGAQLGSDMVKGYFQSLPASQREKYTLSLVDLSKVDPFLKAFNSFSIDVYDYICNQGGLDNVLRSTRYASQFGSGNYNLSDLGELVTANATYSDDANRVMDLLDQAIVYMENGEVYKGVGGLSVYFPVKLPRSGDLPALKNVCVTPYYMAVVDVCAYGKSTMGILDDYDPNQWIDEGSAYWSDTEVDEEGYDYWGNEWDNETDPYQINTRYDKIAVKFETMPHVGVRTDVWLNRPPMESKVVTFTIADGYVDKLAEVYDNIYQEYTDPETNQALYLGLGVFSANTHDFMGSLPAEDVYYASLDGVKYPFSEDRYPNIQISDIKDTVIELPNGQILSQYPYQHTQTPSGEDNAQEPPDLSQIVSPVFYNGVFAALVYGSFSFRDTYPTWRAPVYVIQMTENGMSSRIQDLQAGDVITPLYPAYDPDTLELVELYKGKEYVCVGNEQDYVNYNDLAGDGFKYSMTIEDIYGNTVDTPPVSLHYYSDDEQKEHWECYDILDDPFTQEDTAGTTPAAPASAPTSAPASGEAAPTDPPADQPATYDVTLNVECKKNSLQNKYDVDILLGGQYIATLKHGASDYYILPLEEGSYELEFRINGETFLGNDIYDPDDPGTYAVFLIDAYQDQELSYYVQLTAGNNISVEQL